MTMLRRFRRAALGIAVLVAVQAAMVGVYFLARTSPSGAAFSVERLPPRPAPELVFERQDGSQSTLAELRGKTVLVHFWATWCRPCRKELPALLSTAADLERGGSFQLLAVSVDDDWDQMRAYFDARVPPAVVRPASTGVPRLFGVTSVPDSYVVDAGGRVVGRYAGARDWTSQEARRSLARAIEGEASRP